MAWLNGMIYALEKGGEGRTDAALGDTTRERHRFRTVAGGLIEKELEYK